MRAGIVPDRLVGRDWDYEATIPYAVPDSLDDLRGPVTGVVRVGPHIDTSPDPSYDLAQRGLAWSLYSAVIRAGTVVDQRTLLNRSLLFGLWDSLNLPVRCRQLWEARFPQLTLSGAQVLVFHERLARLGLDVAARYGFVLAGGYAISMNGMGDRPSMDVDLFTNRMTPENFATAADAVEQAYRGAGFDVSETVRAALFLDLHVGDPATGEESDVQLGVNYRAFPPATVRIGPVLDPRDAVAGKMSALWSRGEARDFIDIDTVLASGRFTREDVVKLADEQEAQPMDRGLLAARFRMAELHPAQVYARYGVDGERRTALVARFVAWADEIDPQGP